MTREEYDRLWKPAREVFCATVRPAFTDADILLGVLPSRALAKFLGYDYPVPGFWDEIPMTKELKHKLVKLGGPHGALFVKVEQILKQELAHD